jgi:large repetitive protein
MANGDIHTCTVVVSPYASGPSFSNTATITANEHDPTPGNNTSTATTMLIPANLKVEKTGPATALAFFSVVTYAIKVSNLGPSDAHGVWLTDTLPSGVTFHSAHPGCFPSGGVVNCYLGTITSGGDPYKERWIRVTAGAPGVRTNTATVTLNEFDPTLANNTATAVTNFILFHP